jgi:hypothetical protein
MRGNISDREFESLLQRASESTHSRSPQLLKSAGPKRRVPVAAVNKRRQEFDARYPN